MKIRTALLLPLFAACAVAQAGLVEIAWDGNGRFARAQDVPAGGFAEVCGHLTQGERIEWRFTAARPMDFNIHFHRGNDVITPAEQAAATQGEGTLEVAATEGYCWMWTNTSTAAARVQLTLRRHRAPVSGTGR